MKRAKPILFVILLIASFMAGIWYKGASGNRPPSSKPADESVLYGCPMHPRYTSSQPGDCPSCGMRLVRLDHVSEKMPNDFDVAGGSPQNLVRIGLEKQQLLGVHTGKVEMSSGIQTMRVVGRVAIDETRVYQINAAITGWIREVYPNTVGSLVRKGQPLAAFYAPEFSGPQQAYIYALGTLDRLQGTGRENPDQIALSKTNVQQAADNLRNMGMGEMQLEEIRAKRQLMQKIVINAPADGFILARNVSPGLRFGAGTELYRLADMSHVWVLADIFENEAKLFRPGGRALVSNPAQSNVLPAQVSDILPQFDAATRTLKIRLELDNPGFDLRPDMFVDIDFPINLPHAIVVPTDAVLDTGLCKTVFVDRGNGYFEQRRVETGWRHGGQVQIVAGLKEGEHIVVSGNFFVDSESRFKSAEKPVQNEMGVEPADEHQRPDSRHADAKMEMAGTAVDPICNMTVKKNGPGILTSRSQENTYYFCSPTCKEQFDKEQAQAKRVRSEPVLQSRTGWNRR